MGQPTVGSPGVPPNTGSLMPYDAGVTYDSSGNNAAGGGGSRFGGKWLSGGLSGLSGAGSPQPYYYRGPNRSLPFQPGGSAGQYDAKYFNLQKLAFNSGTAKYDMLQPSGTIRTFHSSGRIESVAGKCGSQTSYSYDSSGNIMGVNTVLEDGTNQYAYAWSGGKIIEVIYRVNARQVLRTVNGYDGNNLVTVKLYENTDDGTPDWGGPISATRYSYHADGRIRHVIPPAQYRQMVNNGIDPDVATESQLNEYASSEYFYTGDRVSLMYKNGRRYSHQFAYAFNYPSGTNLNQWTTRTTVTLSDGTLHVYYFNRIGQMMLHKVAESAASSAKVWYPLYQYFDPDNGRILQSAGNSAIATVSESSPGLVTLNASEGRITVYAYNSDGRQESVGIKKGSGGSVGLLQSMSDEGRSVTAKGTTYGPATKAA